MTKFQEYCNNVRDDVLEEIEQAGAGADPDDEFELQHLMEASVDAFFDIEKMTSRQLLTLLSENLGFMEEEADVSGGDINNAIFDFLKNKIYDTVEKQVEPTFDRMVAARASRLNQP